MSSISLFSDRSLLLSSCNCLSNASPVLEPEDDDLVLADGPWSGVRSTVALPGLLRGCVPRGRVRRPDTLGVLFRAADRPNFVRPFHAWSIRHVAHDVFAIPV